MQDHISKLREAKSAYESHFAAANSVIDKADSFILCAEKRYAESAISQEHGAQMLAEMLDNFAEAETAASAILPQGQDEAFIKGRLARARASFEKLIGFDITVAIRSMLGGQQDLDPMIEQITEEEKQKRFADANSAWGRGGERISTNEQDTGESRSSRARLDSEGADDLAARRKALRTARKVEAKSKVERARKLVTKYESLNPAFGEPLKDGEGRLLDNQQIRAMFEAVDDEIKALWPDHVPGTGLASFNEQILKWAQESLGWNDSDSDLEDFADIPPAPPPAGEQRV